MTPLPGTVLVTARCVDDVLNLSRGDIFAGAFRVVRPLGSGGMGRLYVVTQLQTGKLRALKLLVPQLVAHEDSRARFMQEARAAAAIDSEHVVDIVTAGVDEMTDAPYIVMELLDGQDLAELVESSGPVSLEDVRLIFTHIGHALRRAHSQGIVHRDIKPENVFLANPRHAGERFTAKLLDFGVAKILNGNRASQETQPVGSPLFMAPEQADPAGGIAPPSDVWALGLLAFYLLTGAHYWRSATQNLAIPMMLKEVCFDELDPASIRAAAVAGKPLPEGFDAWFARCVCREISARFVDGGVAIDEFLATVCVTDDAPNEPALGDEVTELSPSPLAKSGSVELDLVRIKPRTETPQTFALATPKPSKVRGFLPSVVVAAGIAVGITSGLAVGLRPSAAAAGRPTEEPQASAVEPPAHVSAPTARPSPAPAFVHEASSPCPRGMVLLGEPAICIDRTEVTVADYTRCVDEEDCKPSRGRASTGRRPEIERARDTLCNAASPARRAHPANCISYEAAEHFCEKSSARLPTESEWLKARAAALKSGPHGAANLCHWECAAWWHDHGLFPPKPLDGDDGYEGTWPATTLARKEPPNAVLDLEGNVSEWVASDPASGALALGSSFATVSPAREDAERAVIPGGVASETIGFRCVYDP